MKRGNADGDIRFSQSHPISAMESYNIAVIGTSAVGKSSFIQRVLGLPRPPISNASSVRMVVDSVTHMITLLELDLDYFELSSPQSIQWPKQINGHIVPRVDAALVLYDVMNQDSIRELPQAVGMHAPPAFTIAWGSLDTDTGCSRPRGLWPLCRSRRLQMRQPRR